MDPPFSSSSSSPPPLPTSSPYAFLPHTTLSIHPTKFKSPSSLASHSFSRGLFPSTSSSSTSTKQRTTNYITQLTSLSSENLIVLTSQGIQIVNKERTLPLSLGLSSSGEEEGENEVTAVASLCSKEGESGGRIWGATDRRGRCRVYDARSSLNGGGSVLQVESPTSSPLLCLAFSPSSSSSAPLLALGHELHSIDAPVHIYDLRNLSMPLLTYDQSHSDDVTSLQFRSSEDDDDDDGAGQGRGDLLLSASTDGLLTVYDLQKGADEDDAVLSASNTGASIARAGWGGTSADVGVRKGQRKPSDQESDGMDVDGSAAGTSTFSGTSETDVYRGLGAVWAVSDMQTVGIWDSESTDALLPPLSILPLSTNMPASSSWGPTYKYVPDYIVDCHPTSSLSSSSAAGLSLWTGNQSGTFTLSQIPSPPVFPGNLSSAEGTGGFYDSESHLRSVTSQPWTLTHLFPSEGDSARGGHSDIVRCIESQADPTPTPSSDSSWSGLLWSGGEDGKLVVWRVGDGMEESGPGFGGAVGSRIGRADGNGGVVGAVKAQVMDEVSFSRRGGAGAGGGGATGGRYRPYG